MNPPRILELKVTLRHIRPPIWRRFQVRDRLTLDQLHAVLQFVMGWTNSHLHEFTCRGERYCTTDPELDLPPPRADERQVRLGELLVKPNDQLTYEYDFGDGWEHEVVLERVVPHIPHTRYPIVIAGRRACPPEDCGGPGGYAHLLEALCNPAHPEHQDLTEWVGGSFDPEAFDLEALNAFNGGRRVPDEGESAAAPGTGRAPRQTALRLGRGPRRG